jgi:hypothetical protein
MKKRSYIQSSECDESLANSLMNSIVSSIVNSLVSSLVSSLVCSRRTRLLKGLSKIEHRGGGSSNCNNQAGSTVLPFLII